MSKKLIDEAVYVFRKKRSGDLLDAYVVVKDRHGSMVGHTVDSSMVENYLLSNMATVVINDYHTVIEHNFQIAEEKSDGKVKYVSVKFNSYGTKYDFKTDLDLKVGDQVVCDSSNGLGIAKVVEVKKSSNLATRWIVQKVDLDKHKERIEKDKKLSEIKAKMEKRRQEIQEIEIYSLLAKQDNTMAKLLAEYELINSKS